MKKLCFLFFVFALFCVLNVSGEYDNHSDEDTRADSHSNVDIPDDCGFGFTAKLNDGVLTISGSGAMSKCDLPQDDIKLVKSVVISSGITTIPYEAFKGWEFSSTTIPDSVQSISTDAFSDCYNLTSLHLPDRLTSIPSGMCFACGSLVSVSIPDSVKSIGSYAFALCHSLTKLTLPASLKSVYAYACNDCNKLKELTIPKNVSAIGENAFSSCSSLVRFDVEPGNEHFEVIDGVLFNKGASELVQCPGARTGKFVVPSFVTTIKRGAFRGCLNLTSLVIPDSVTTIEGTAFCWNRIKSISYLGENDPGHSNTDIFDSGSLPESILVRWNYANTSFCGSDPSLLSRCFLVKSEGLLQQEWLARNGTTVGESNEDIVPFLQSDSFIVGDSQSHDVITENTTVDNDMEVVVMKKIAVVIEFDATLKDIDKGDLVLSVSNLVSVDPEHLLISVIFDDNNEVIQIQVFVDDQDIALQIVDGVNGIERTQSCSSGVLCQSKRAYFFGEDLSSSDSLFSIEVGIRDTFSFLIIAINCFLFLL